MTTLAIFVKTPGLSPVKTRLQATIGHELAIEFYRIACQIIEEAAEGVPDLATFWAVAEAEGLQRWATFPAVHQGEGDLGARLDNVFRRLIDQGPVLLVGADCPAISANLLREAMTALQKHDYVIGPASDGGYYLFGGRKPIASAIWHQVTYSSPDTYQQFTTLLRPTGSIAVLPELSDVDESRDFPSIQRTLAANPTKSPRQQLLLRWFSDNSRRLGLER